MNLFEAKVKRVIVDPKTGKDKKITEKYLLDAMTFTETEARMNEEIEKIHNGDFLITDIKMSNISEIDTESNGEILYVAKVSFISVDEDCGKEKKTIFRILTPADNIDEAYSNTNRMFADSISDYVIEGVTDSKIQDYIPYTE